MPRRMAGSAAAPGASPLFLDGDDGLSLGELLLQAGILTRKSGDFVGERVARCWFRARRGRGQGRRTTLEALTPLGHLRGIETMAAKERAAAGITARIGIILLQDELAFSGSQAQACRRCG